MFTLLGTLTCVSSEGKALWILFTLPEPLEASLRRKALLWLGIATTVAIPVVAYVVWLHRLHISMIWMAAYGLVGLVRLAHVGVALGCFAADPLAKEHVSPLAMVKSMYLMLWLEGIYTYGFLAEGLWPTIGLLLMLGAFTPALGAAATGATETRGRACHGWRARASWTIEWLATTSSTTTATTRWGSHATKRLPRGTRGVLASWVG